MKIPDVSQLLNFAGKVVLVTGAGSGLGSGIARRFAEAGATVAAHYNQSLQGATEVVKAISHAGGRAVALQADVTREEDVARLVADCIAQLGGLHVLVNNAGVYPLHPLLDMPASQWDAVIAGNLRSAFLCTQAGARHMATHGGGAIVNISSIEAESPAPGHAHYNAAKAGLHMLTKASAAELGMHGIRVNAVAPGLIWREGIEQGWPDGVKRWQAAAPLQRLGRAEDVADACLFLASPAARWVTGVNLVVDGGVMTAQTY